MPFTAAELQNIANATLDYHMDRMKVHSQTIQNKPLFAAMRRKQKTFMGGKENITVRVKGAYTTTIQGFEHDDTVTYGNPANIKEASYPWKMIHAGIQFTHHELLKSGISVVDSTTGARTVTHSDRELSILADLLQDKLEDMTEGNERGHNEMMWKDGTQDAKQYAGIQHFIRTTPTTAAVVGGLDQGVNTWWRNRAEMTINLGSAVSDQAVVNFLQKEWRQLTRYGGMPDLWLAGSDMMERIEKELRANGNYTDTGWANKGSIDFGMDDLAFKGKRVTYDPTLDDLGYAKRLYCIDTSAIYPMVIEGEDLKKHAPARPEDKYVFYRAVTWAGAMVCKRRNSSGVYAFA